MDHPTMKISGNRVKKILLLLTEGQHERNKITLPKPYSNVDIITKNRKDTERVFLAFCTKCMQYKIIQKVIKTSHDFFSKDLICLFLSHLTI